MKQNCQKKKLELEIKINYIMTNVNIYEDHKVTTNAWLIQAELYQRYVYYDRREEESGRGGERKTHTCMVACSLARSQVRTNALKTPPPPTTPPISLVQQPEIPSLLTSTNSYNFETNPGMRVRMLTRFIDAIIIAFGLCIIAFGLIWPISVSLSDLVMS